jgi:hypothetical protein
MSETAWLIEAVRNDSGHRWWTGAGGPGANWWTSDPNACVRFSRKQDAEAVIAGVNFGEPSVATEHEWMDAARRGCQPATCVSLKETGRKCPPGHGCNNPALQ